MINEFTPNFHFPTQVYIRQDLISSIPEILKNYGQRVLVITTTDDMEIYSDEIEQLSSILERSDLGCIIYDDIANSPNTEDLDSVVYFAKKTNCDVILAFGGMDSINIAKSVAILATNFMFSDDLFSSTKANSPLPLVVFPTHPLFGWEVVPMLYLSDIHNSEKKVYQNIELYPKACLYDPALSLKTADKVLAANALCTISLATEAVISKTSNTFMNTFALKAIDLVVKNLPIAYNDSQNTTSRWPLCSASIMAGMTFSISQFSAGLAIALAVNSVYDISVENILSLILPHIMDYNLTACPGRYVQLAKVMDEDVKDITVIEAAIKAVEKVRKLQFDVNLPQRLTTLDITKNKFQQIASLANNYAFCDNAPRALSQNEIETILIAAY